MGDDPKRSRATIDLRTVGVGRSCFVLVSADEETEQQRNAGQPLHMAQVLFPSCLCAAILPIVCLLDDSAVTSDGVAVHGVAHQVVSPWSGFVTLTEVSRLESHQVSMRASTSVNDYLRGIVDQWNDVLHQILQISTAS